MRILVFGAMGSVGSRVMAEALSRGHEVTAVVRRENQPQLPAGARGRIGDALHADDVAMLCKGQDVVISAARPPTGSERQLVDMAEALLAGAKESGTRLILVGGAARLKVPDTGEILLNDSRYVPSPIRDIALASHMQFKACAQNHQTDWTYVSPPALLLPGVRTGRYRLGNDTLLLDEEGRSTISIEDFAVALMDEAESPAHHRQAFTVAAQALEVKESEVTIRTPDGIADCSFIHPENGAHPGIIIWPDILGVRPAFQAIGKRLAGAGYSVLIINPYYRRTVAPIGINAEQFGTADGREQAGTLASGITSDMTTADATAFVDFLDEQQPVDYSRRLGAIGFCMGGAMAIRTAAARCDRIGAVASFHGGKLVTQDDDSPHRLVPQTRAEAFIAIAGNDDEKYPDMKVTLRTAYDKAGLEAKIEVYPGALHGWCVPDMKAYNPVECERAWSELLRLFNRALVQPDSTGC